MATASDRSLLIAREFYLGHNGFDTAFGLHAALIVGQPKPVAGSDISLLVEQLARFNVRLMKNGELVEEGSGRNSLRSPALCLAELAAAIARGPDAETPL